MKVGMIFESGPQGAEKQVCEYLALKIRPGITIRSVTHRNKPEMISDCGKDVVHLLHEDCERILIVWDLFPPWRMRGAKPCRREDRLAIRNSLKMAGVLHAPVLLVCIREELEAWLLTDGSAIAEILKTPTHPVRALPHAKHPDRISNPKGRLRKLFQTHHHGPFNDLVHAIKIVEHADLRRLRRSESFCRFEEKLLA